MPTPHARPNIAVALALAVVASSPASASDGSTPYDPTADLANMSAAYGRITGPGGQLQSPAYLPALAQ